MMLVLLLAVPVAGGAALVAARGATARLVHLATSGLTLAAAVAVAAAVVRETAVLGLDGTLRVDPLGAWMVVLVTLVAAMAAVEAPRQVPPEAAPRFYPLFHLFVFTMLLAVSSDDVGLMWVAVEGTTLASVFLVGLERTRTSLEASYKYLLICSVGIAIAFVGTVLVYFADVQQFGHVAYPLRWTTLIGLAPALPARVVQLAFVFILVGYGTKAGLAPMHTWLPDAHSEAPAPVSALMSGVLLSVGVYAVLRFKLVVDLAAGPGFSRRLMVGLGLASMGVAAAFLWTPTNYKRMLAYSSVEHMGVVALGLGFGGPWGVGGAILHLANHALAKSSLFLLAGRIRAAYGSSEIRLVRGLATALPVTGRAFLVALLALMGLPPFGIFISEVMVLGAGFQRGAAIPALLALVFLVLAFGGLLRAAHRMLFGPCGERPPQEVLPWSIMAPVGAALGLLVVTGLAWPPGLATTLERIADIVGH